MRFAKASIMQWKTSVHLSAGAAWLCVCGTALAFEAVKNIVYPSPGLYRVVTKSTMKDNGASGAGMAHEIEQDSATGNARTTTTRPGEAPLTNSYAGQAPLSQCIKSLPASGAIPAATSCKTSAPVVGANTLTYTSVCAGMKVNITIKKIDDKNWEYTTAFNYGAGDQTATQTMVQRYTRIANTCPATAAR